MTIFQFFQPVVQCEQWITMATIVNNRRQVITQNMLFKHCLKVEKFPCFSFSGLRAVEESSVGWDVLPPA